jgi:hypothetical protein
MHGRCVIELLSDRTKPGALTLFGPDGKILHSCICLGRSAGWFDKVRGIVNRDPLVYRGNTPTGEYALTSVAVLPKPMTGIGTLWATLDPVGGQAQVAENLGRRGLGIHGGRGETLKPTHGCIRLRDSDMAALAKAAGKLRFTVTITERAA